MIPPPTDRIRNLLDSLRKVVVELIGIFYSIHRNVKEVGDSVDIINYGHWLLLEVSK